MNKLEQYLGKEWYSILKDEFSKPYMNVLSGFVQDRRSKNTVYPPSNEVFNAYKLTPYSKVRVCIIGQDPYINPNEAMGLAFSTRVKVTPTIVKLREALGKQIPTNLTPWTEQGVMLLNAVLTVDAGKSASHKGMGWESFVVKTIEELDKKGVIFMLWGRDAQSFKAIIKNSKILECEHPVAASYQKRAWNHKDCFNEVNNLLDEKIKW